MAGIAQFFDHLVAYGGISIEDGVIYVWVDPNIFVPADAYAVLQEEGRKEFGNDFLELLYWLGKFSGYNASVMLNKRFGLKVDRCYEDDHKDIDNFGNGATQDGWGYCEIISFVKRGQPISFDVTNKESKIAQSSVLIYGKQEKYMGHPYLSGILAGGTQFVFNKDCKSEEKECMMEGKPQCLFTVSETATKEHSKLLQQLKLDEEFLYKKGLDLYFGRQHSFKIITKRNVKFGDGNFMIDKFSGCVIGIMAFTILNHVLQEKLGDKKTEYFDKITRKQTENIRALYPDIKIYNERNLLKVFEILQNFGFGSFRVTQSSKTRIIIANTNNPMTDDHKSFFGISKNPVDLYVTHLLKNTLSVMFSLDVKVEEMLCKAQGKPACIYQVDFLSTAQ
jgi:predicted hydrocarbon binding protein